MVVREKVPGAFAECGTWNGGAGALLARIASRDKRVTWLFDAFEGLPPPSALDVTLSGEQGKRGDLKGSEATVKEALAVAGVPRSAVQIVKAWFEETLRPAETGPIAFSQAELKTD
jgi:hypothetical protein